MLIPSDHVLCVHLEADKAGKIAKKEPVVLFVSSLLIRSADKAGKIAKKEPVVLFVK